MGCAEGKKYGLVGIADHYTETALDEDGTAFVSTSSPRA